MGEVAAKVITNAPCKVLVVPKAAQLEYKNIPAATDGLTQANAAVAEAIAIAKRCGSHLIALSAMRDESARADEAHGLDALNSVGGDGSLSIAYSLATRGLRVIGVPKTIDNDLDRTYMTFGFDTAVSFATECLDRLHTTAASHHRLMIVEVMGRYAGWTALHAGIAGNAYAILIPEIPYELDKVADHIRRREKKGRLYTLIVVAEGAKPKGGQVTLLEPSEPGQSERLGGVGEKVARELESLVGREAGVSVLGHLLRGGSPTSFDRLVALRIGAAAVRALEAGHSGVKVSLEPPHVHIGIF